MGRVYFSSIEIKCCPLWNIKFCDRHCFRHQTRMQIHWGSSKVSYRRCLVCFTTCLSLQYSLADGGGRKGRLLLFGTNFTGKPFLIVSPFLKIAPDFPVCLIPLVKSEIFEILTVLKIGQKFIHKRKPAQRNGTRNLTTNVTFLSAKKSLSPSITNNDEETTDNRITRPFVLQSF